MDGMALEEDGRPGREFNGQQEMNKRIPKCHWERTQAAEVCASLCSAPRNRKGGGEIDQHRLPWLACSQRRKM